MADREMTSRERLEHVWNFQEPDRVPIEMNISAEAARDPRSAKVRELMAKYSDRFYGWSPNWGWFGMPVKTESKVIEDKPGEYKRVQRIVHSPIGDFDSIDWYPASTIDYAWEKMYFSTPDDLRKLRDVPFYPLKIDPSSYQKRVKQVEDRGLVAVNVPNPFGILVRSAKREDFFSWLILERTLIHDVLSILFAHVTQKLEYLLSIIDAKYFSSSGQELALDPWMSPAMYD
jgi:hypothetical protein